MLQLQAFSQFPTEKHICFQSVMTKFKVTILLGRTNCKWQFNSAPFFQLMWSLTGIISAKVSKIIYQNRPCQYLLLKWPVHYGAREVFSSSFLQNHFPSCCKVLVVVPSGTQNKNKKNKFICNQSCWKWFKFKPLSSKYRPFHKTLPRSSAFLNRVSVRFYETGCIKIKWSNG